MRQKVKRETMPEELALAIGVVWGFLNAYQYEEAYKLARGCLSVWPDEVRLRLMYAYASVELLEPLDDAAMDLLRTTDARDWADMVLRRLEMHEKSAGTAKEYMQ